MNENTKKLVTENMGLAVYVANMYRNQDQIEYNDLIQIAYIGLIKAANNYDETTGNKFSTFSVYVMKNEIRCAFRSDNKVAKIKTQSLDLVINSGSESKDVELHSLIKDDTANKFEDDKANKEMVSDLLSELNEKERMIVELAFGIGCDKRSQPQISIETGVSQAHVSRIRTRSLLKMKHKYLEWCGGVI